MFDPKDLEQIALRQIRPEEIERQIHHFIHGFPFIRLVRPATHGDGILFFTGDVAHDLVRYFDEARSSLRIVKFVPASGAASRMFKHLFEYRDQCSSGEKEPSMQDKDLSFNSVQYLMKHLKEIAFAEELSDRMKTAGISLDTALTTGDYCTIIDYILTPAGLDYANLPKGLLSFHRYPEGARTSAGEHLVEAAEYAADGNQKARIHFTISPEHKAKFLSMFGQTSPLLEQRFGVTFSIDYSIQSPSTDTIAVDEENKPCRNPDGTLLFRPGGHGSLLTNLENIDADLVFVKNIDNVVPDRLKEETIRYKKLLAGLLLQIRNRINGYLQVLDSGSAEIKDLEEIEHFARHELLLDIPSGKPSATQIERTEKLIRALNRPIRVCGMVRNEGEPGGGPFWVSDADGRQSLQIVESSQIDMKNLEQAAILKSSTHFNPVDLVCSTIDFRGKRFNLNDFVDEETGFISLKSTGGKTLKALERPGLWNGAMAGWITLFVEVPVITFNPVKTVNDLLRKEHLPN